MLILALKLQFFFRLNTRIGLLSHYECMYQEKVARDVEMMQERVAEKSLCIKNDMETSQSSVTDRPQNLERVPMLVSNENKPSCHDDHDDDIDEPTTENLSGIGSKMFVLY